MKIKILIADDSAVVRSMLKRLFEQDERFELCPLAENGRDAVKKNDFYKPDFIIMDLNMPIMNGLESAKEILSKSNPAIVAFTTEDYADVSFKSFEIGILSVIRKLDLAKMKQQMLQEFIDKIYFIAESHIQKIQREKQKTFSFESEQNLSTRFEDKSDFKSETDAKSKIAKVSKLGDDDKSFAENAGKSGETENFNANDEAFIEERHTENFEKSDGKSSVKTASENRAEMDGENKSSELNAERLKNPHHQKKIKIYSKDFIYLKKHTAFGKYKILAIGASTGGPGALKRILCGLGKNFPLPIIITQHNESGFDTYLSKWLALSTEMNVKIASNYEILLPGTAYLAPSNFHLTLTTEYEPKDKVRIKLDSGSMINFMRPAVDKMFESTAEIFGKHTIALVLTGMGKDGALSCKKLFDCGAFTIAEAEDDCVVFGMPRAAIEEGAICCVSRLDAIPKIIKQKLIESGVRVFE